MNESQRLFDEDLRLAMTRRSFLKSVAQASSAALVLTSPIGCGHIAGQVERQREGDAAPIFDPVQRAVVQRIIDGFAPPDTPIRRRFAEEDPEYDLVGAYADFAWAHGDQFLNSMKFLVDFLNVLPTFTPTFFTRYGLPTVRLRRLGPDDANRFFLHLRDSPGRALRNIFTGAKFIATAPLYGHEEIGWSEMDYGGPWILDPYDPDSDRERSTSYELAAVTQDNVSTLERSVVKHKDIAMRLSAAELIPSDKGLVIETDVVIVGSGAGGSFIASEIAALTNERVLVLEMGDFVHPTEFAQREILMMPRIFHTEFSTTHVPGTDMEVPTVSTAAVTGKLVGGSATINHALAFEPPKPVVQDWHDRLGADLQYDDLRPHLDVINDLLRIAPVSEAQISGSNWRLREGARKLGMPHHGPSRRNAHECIGCGYCDLGCRYNRKLTPLNMVLPIAARHGAQVIPNCHVDEVLLEELPGDGVAGRTHRATGLKATLTDRRGTRRDTLTVRAKRVVLAAGPFSSPRILMRSRLPAIRRRKGSQPAIGERFSTHGTITFYADFDEPIFPAKAGPPMAYFVKKYEVEDQAAADPARHHIKYALEGMLNHPIAHAQLMPYESAESYQAFMRRFNQTMTLAVMFRDKPVGKVTPKAFEYALAEEDHPGWLDSIQTGARLMFASGAKRVFFNAHRPLILNGPDEIETQLTLDLVKRQLIQITSGHPMGGNALGGDPKRDVVDARGRSWDVTGLYVADSSILPTSLGINPCLTTYALGRWIAHNMVDEIRG